MTTNHDYGNGRRADRDIAILVSQECLPSTADILAESDRTPLRAEVSVIGHAVIPDGEHEYRYLVAPGEWAGPAERDGIQLGSMTATRIMPGMSGAPVVRDSDGAVIGIVSGRYNSADGWLAGNVWVARAEDLVPLLRQVAGISVDRVLVIGEDVTTVLRVSRESAVAREPASRSISGPPPGDGGLREAAWEAARILAALDDAARGAGALTDVVDGLLASAASNGRHGAQEVDSFRRRMTLRGLDPRLLVTGIARHDEAAERWAEQIPGADAPPGNGGPPSMLASFVGALAEKLSGALFSAVSPHCRALLGAALADGNGGSSHSFLGALDELLPTRFSGSREVVVYRPAEEGAEGAPSSGHTPPRLTYRQRGLRSAASQLCRLPDADPRTRGREDLVAEIVGAAGMVMTRDGVATCFLSGQPGVGTSTVAADVARRLAPAFPDGVWYVNLHGLVPGLRRDARTVVRLLAEAIELDLGAGAMDDDRMFAAFAAQLSQRKILIVLDNAADAAHVQRLAHPPPGCAVVVTSRNRLQDYASAGLAFGVEALRHSAAVEVLTTFAEGRTHEPSQLDALARLCDHVPLALQLIGARIAVRPAVDLDYLIHLLTEEANRLEYLKVGERAVRAAIQLSYDNIDPDAQQVLCFITAVPGSMASASELGHSLGEPVYLQEMLLNRLEDRNLVQHRITKSYITGSLLATFSPFELVRLFAREKLNDKVSAERIDGFQKKAVEYLADRLQEIVDHSHDAELSWELDPTRLHAALRVAEEHEWLDLATDLALNLHVFYLSRHEVDGASEIHDTLVTLHLRRGQYEEAVRACLRAAESLGDLGASQKAVTAAHRARELALAHDLPLLAAEADFATSVLLWKLKDITGAFDASERAALALIDLGHQAGAIPAVLNTCALALEEHQTGRAVLWGRRATELADSAGSAAQQADAAFDRSRAEGRAGNIVVAIELSRRAAATYEHTKHWWNSAVAFQNGAFLARQVGDTARVAELLSSAADRWEQAVKDDSRPHLVECLIDLSATQAEMSAFVQVQNSLKRAAAVIAKRPGSIPPLMRTEVYVRNAAARLFLENATPGRSDEETVSISIALEHEETEQPGQSDAELERVSAVVDRFNRGKLIKIKAQKLVTEFLASTARHHADSPPFWIHEKMRSLSRPVSALSTSPATDGRPPALK